MQLLIFFLGVIAAIVAYIFSNFFLEPINRYYEIRSKIGYKLTYYSHIITSPGSSDKLMKEAYAIIRDLACDLERRYLAIRLRRLTSHLRAIPSDNTINSAKGELIFISNSLGESGSHDKNIIAIGRIFKLLGIKELQGGAIVKSAEIYENHE